MDARIKSAHDGFRNAVAANVSFVEIATDKGHDAFLLDVPELMATAKGFLDAAAKVREV